MLGAIAAAVLSSSSALAQLSDDMVKIGVLTDMNGPASTPTGQGSVTAAQMAVDDFGGSVLGKPISIIVGDHQLKPDIGGGIATRAAARAAGLDFVPLLSENFDLLMRQRSYFRPSMQALVGFLGQQRLQQRAAELAGYDTAPAGQIRFAA